MARGSPGRRASVTTKCEEVTAFAKRVASNPSHTRREEFKSSLQDAISSLQNLERVLSDDFNREHGEGRADSQRFRIYMAEMMATHPAINLDTLRETLKTFLGLKNFIDSPEGTLAFEKVWILFGTGGSGKTHGLCDVARKRLAEGAYTCVLFGHEFNGEPEPWSRVSEVLGLPPTLGKDGVLDSLNAASEASGRTLIFCIDAANETRPREYWSRRFLSFASDVEKRSFLKFCISCRTSFLLTCLPNVGPHPIVEHRGFAGMERQACDSFFRHFHLEPPFVPILYPPAQSSPLPKASLRDSKTTKPKEHTTWVDWT